jgi:hypothetical protein
VISNSLRRAALLAGSAALLLLGGAACSPSAAPTALPASAFDLKGFLDGQRQYLESVAPTVTKTVRTGDNPVETARLSRVNWERELQFFYDADLNKPALRGLYTEVGTPLPEGGTRRSFTRRPDETTPIRELIVDLGPDNSVRQLRATQDDHNALFHSERYLLLTLDPDPDHNRLVSYEVRGRQKLIFFDPTTYEVRGEID